MDLGTTRVFLESRVPRVTCRYHGVVVAAVPWARAQSRFSREFEDQCAWLAIRTNRTAVSELLRIAWTSVGRIVERIGTEARARVDLLAGLRRIGFDELSHRKGHKYVTVVVDHDSGRIVWMSPGRDRDTVRAFFTALGTERTAQLQLVSADGAPWIDDVVREKAPQAVRCMDTFHVVQWATMALDKVRREVWNGLRKTGHSSAAVDLKGARWALWKNPENLTARQQRTLAWVQEANAPLYRAYLLKESIRTVFKQPTAEAGRDALDSWLRWASRCRLRPFVELARSIRERHRERIEATLAHGLTNARIEAANGQLRLLLRLAYGFHDVNAFIALAMLKLARLCPPLPGRPVANPEAPT
jgi:transposase